MTRRWDVLVIGGGFAGLAAARELDHGGADVVLLEARERLGGRTWTGPFGTHTVELGGAFVHWMQAHVWSELLRYGIEVARPPEAERSYWISGGGHHEGTPDQVGALLEEGVEWFCRDAAEAIPDPFVTTPTPLAIELDRLSVQDRLDEMDDPDLRDLQDAVWTSLGSGPASETGLVPTALGTFALSGWHTDLVWETTGGYTIVGGTGALVDAVRADLHHAEVRERARVIQLERTERGVRATSEDGIEHEARACVVALPVNALRGIAFTPDLDPGRRAVVDAGILGRGFKLWVRLRGEIAHVNAMAPGDHPINYFETTRHVDGETLAVGFGGRASDLDLRDLPAVRAAVAELVPDADVIDCGGHDWIHDPLALTTWGSFRPGQLTRSLDDLQRSELRTFFAGGDTATGWSGYIDGAIGSGIAAGRAALAFLGSG